MSKNLSNIIHEFSIIMRRGFPMAQPDVGVDRTGWTKVGNFWIALCVLGMALVANIVIGEHRITVIEDKQQEQQRQMDFLSKQYSTIMESQGRIEGSVGTLTNQLIGVSDTKPNKH